MEVLLLRCKLELVTVIVVRGGSDAARRTREGERGAVGAAGEGARGGGPGAVVGLLVRVFKFEEVKKGRTKKKEVRTKKKRKRRRR